MEICIETQTETEAYTEAKAETEEACKRRDIDMKVAS